MARLSKRDVEELMRSYDANPQAALAAALAKVLDLPDAGWGELLRVAPLSEARRAAIAAGERHELDRLAAELNEVRGFDTGDTGQQRR